MVVQSRKIFKSMRKYSMTPQSFVAWAQRRDRERHDHVPEADKVVPLVAQAGAQGMARSDIGKGIDLDRDTLSALLDSLVRSGILTVRREGGIDIFRAR